jgi:hypothetical protein
MIVRSRAQTIAIILSKYKKRAGVHSSALEATTPNAKTARMLRDEFDRELRDRRAVRADLGHGKHWITPAGDTLSVEPMDEHYTLAESFPEVNQDKAGIQEQAFRKGYVRAQQESDSLMVELNDRDPVARKNAIAYLKARATPGVHIYVDRDGQDGFPVSSKRHTTLASALAHLNEPAQGTSFAMSTPKAGLRNVINKLKAEGHVARDSRTVFRSQPSKYDANVAKDGFKLTKWIRGSGDTHQVFTGSRRTAELHGNLLRPTQGPISLFKARIPKFGLAVHKVWYGSTQGHEYLSPIPIGPSHIRKVKQRRFG